MVIFNVFIRKILVAALMWPSGCILFLGNLVRQTDANAVFPSHNNAMQLQMLNNLNSHEDTQLAQSS